MVRNIVVNAFPKHGTHAALKACWLLGTNPYLGHFPHKAGLPEDTTHHVFIKRDPRDALLSSVRAQGHPMTQGMFIRMFRRFENVHLVEELSAFTPWLSDANTLVLKYEDLIASDGELHRLASYLGEPYLDDAFANLPGHTITWRIPHVDYRTLWTPQVEEIWNAEGGTQLLKDWGYG